MATSYANLGGTGFRAWISPLLAGLTFSGFPSELVNGNTSGNTFFFTNGQTISGSCFFEFFFIGAAVVIDEAKWYQNSATNEGTWQWQGSNDNISFTNIGSSFTLGGATPFQTMTQLNGNVTAYKFYRLLGVSGTTSSTPFLQEIEFKIDANAVIPYYDYIGIVPPKMYISLVPQMRPQFFGGGGGPVTPVPVAVGLKSAFRGVAYSETVGAQGGTGSGYVFNLASGSLPTGTSLNSSTGIISGTPTALGTFSFTIGVTDSGLNTGSQAFQIIVSALSPVVPVAANLAGGVVGVAYSETISVQGGTGSGNVFAVTGGSLPTGLTLHTGTGVIDGTPTTPGTYSFTIGVTDSAGNTGSEAFQIIVTTGASAGNYAFAS